MTWGSATSHRTATRGSACDPAGADVAGVRATVGPDEDGVGEDEGVGDGPPDGDVEVGDDAGVGDEPPDGDVEAGDDPAGADAAGVRATVGPEEDGVGDAAPGDDAAGRRRPDRR